MFIIYVIFGCFVSCVTSDTYVDEYYENIKNEPNVKNFLDKAIQKCKTYKVDRFDQKAVDLATDIAKECEKKFPTNQTYPDVFDKKKCHEGEFDRNLGCANHCFLQTLENKTGLPFSNKNIDRPTGIPLFDEKTMTLADRNRSSNYWVRGIDMADNVKDTQDDCLYWGCHGYYVHHRLRSKGRCFRKFAAQNLDPFR